MAYLLISDAILFKFGPFLKNLTVCDGPTDGPTNQRKDTPLYTDAKTQLKMARIFIHVESYWQGCWSTRSLNGKDRVGWGKVGHMG